jgi:hypothetical protein
MAEILPQFVSHNKSGKQLSGTHHAKLFHITSMRQIFFFADKDGAIYKF